MLTEYALTPQLFDDQYNSDDPEWLERLRVFGERLLPAGAARLCNSVVSDLYDGSWYASTFQPLIQDLDRRQSEDHTKVLPALGLLKALRPRLEACLVIRPLTSGKWPETEEAWASEAEASAAKSKLPFHRLVGSQKLALAPGRHCLHRTVEEPFWDAVPTAQTLPADVDQQLLAIRRMCSFYSFFAFASPQLMAHGGGKDLTFALRLAKSTFQRPFGFSQPNRIDLHVQGTTDGDPQRKQQADAILQRAEIELGPAVKTVRVFLWPTVKERRLLVGHSDGNGLRPQVIWGVVMTHVARPDSDDPKTDRHTFSLLDRRETSRLTSDYYDNTRLKPYAGSPFTG
jgi:hypothetical protein